MAYQYGKYLISSGHEVKFLLIEDRVDIKYADVDIIKCISSSLSSSVFHLSKLKFEKETIFISLIPLLTFSFMISRVIRFEFNIRYIFTVHNNVSKDFGAGFLGFVLKKIYLSILKSSKNVYSVSESLNGKLNGLGVKSKLLPNKVIHSFVPVKRVCEDKLSFLMIGRIDRQKDYFKAIEFFSFVKELGRDFVVDIFGEGPLKEDLKNRLDILGFNNVTFKGYSDNIESVLEDGKYNALLLTSAYEGFGLVVVEAISKCIYPIVRDCEFGPREIIDNGVGSLLPFNFDKSDVETAINNYDEWSKCDRAEMFEKCKMVHLKYTKGSETQWQFLNQHQ